MGAPADLSQVVVNDKRELVAYLERGAKPREHWRIGTEHEKFGYSLDDLRPLPYEGPAGIRAMLEGLGRFSWRPVLEEGKVISLEMDGQAITRYPAQQWKSLRTTNAIQRLYGEFKRPVKSQCALPNAEAAAMLLWTLMASGQITMRPVDGWETLDQAPVKQTIDLAA